VGILVEMLTVPPLRADAQVAFGEQLLLWCLRDGILKGCYWVPGWDWELVLLLDTSCGR
jgi:hypothetical protein